MRRAITARELVRHCQITFEHLLELSCRLVCMSTSARMSTAGVDRRLSSELTARFHAGSRLPSTSAVHRHPCTLAAPPPSVPSQVPRARHLADAVAAALTASSSCAVASVPSARTLAAFVSLGAALSGVGLGRPSPLPRLEVAVLAQAAAMPPFVPSQRPPL